MTTAPSTPDGPIIPMPDKTPAALRIAVAQLAPDAVATFDEHWRTAMEQARSQYSLLPGRAFVEHWWSWVAVARYPERLARFRECERIVAESPDRAERRGAAAELARILAGAEDDAARVTGPGSMNPAPAIACKGPNANRRPGPSRPGTPSQAGAFTCRWGRRVGLYAGFCRPGTSRSPGRRPSI